MRLRAYISFCLILEIFSKQKHLLILYCSNTLMKSTKQVQIVKDFSISKSAVEKFKEFAKAEGRNDITVRLSLSNSCHGVSYELEFVDKPSDSESTFVNNGITVCVNKENKDFLKGVEIDYVKDDHGEGFKITNTNDGADCCGSGSCGSGGCSSSSSGCGCC